MLIVLGVSLWATAGLAPFLAVLVILGSLVTGASLWGKGSLLAKAFIERNASAGRSYREATAALEQSAGIPLAFATEKERLRAIKSEYEGLASLKARRVRELELNRERQQRQHFLERFRLEDERIPNIGDKNKQVLYTWGILDASDVEELKIRQIKGFGPVKIQSLLDWRQQKERQFRFDPLQPVDPRDLLALEQEIMQKSTSLQAALRAGPVALQQIIGVWQAQRRQLLTNMVSCANQFARAQVDLSALRRF